MKSLELFVGAGGLAMGLHRSGFLPVSVIERDSYCCDTIRENQKRRIKAVGEWKLLQDDVRSIDFTQFETKVELVSGGPPCQPFSLGGRHEAHDDARDMFPEAIRAVRQAKPRVFIFENVKGLTRERFRNYFEYIRLQMEHPSLAKRKGENWISHLARLERHHTTGKRSDLHYRVVVRMLNAADFGVPQKRERVFFVGFRDDLGIEWSFPSATHSLDALLWSQEKDGTYWEQHGVRLKDRFIHPRIKDRARRLEEKPRTSRWQTVRDALAGLPDPEREPLLASQFWNHQFQPGARSYAGHTGSLPDEPAKTLKAGVHGVPGGENMLARTRGSPRYFTVRESARLQTFPDDFIFHGSWSETMRQLGNAVPVLLGTAVGSSVRKQLARTQMKANAS